MKIKYPGLILYFIIAVEIRGIITFAIEEYTGIDNGNFGLYVLVIAIVSLPFIISLSRVAVQRKGDKNPLSGIRAAKWIGIIMILTFICFALPSYFAQCKSYDLEPRFVLIAIATIVVITIDMMPYLILKHRQRINQM